METRVLGTVTGKVKPNTYGYLTRWLTWFTQPMGFSLGFGLDEKLPAGNLIGFGKKILKPQYSIHTHTQRHVDTHTYEECWFNSSLKIDFFPCKSSMGLQYFKTQYSVSI